MRTKVITDEEFNGHKLFKVYAIDDMGRRMVEFDKKTGEPKEMKPIVNIGLKKAKAVFKHYDDLLTFIEDN